MSGHDDDDPVAPPVPFRFPSGSPEAVFHRCPFLGYSDSDSSDSEDFRVESTSIFMLSLPDTMEPRDDSASQSYKIASEELVPTGFDGRPSVPAMDAIGEEVAVDLGRDTDVGLFSEVQPTMETGEKGGLIDVIGVCRSGPEWKKSGLPFVESVVSLGESSSKRLRLSEEALGLSSCARTVLDEIPADSTNSGGGPKIVPASSVGHNNGDENSGGKCKLKGMCDGKDNDGENVDNDGENVEEKSAEKEMENAGMDDEKVSNGEVHCNYKEKSARKEVKEGVKNSQSHEQSKHREEIANGGQSSPRKLPPSISGVQEKAAGTAGKKSNTSEDPPKITLLDILKLLKEEDKSKTNEESLSELSIFEIAKCCGMQFPRPTWWPPGF